MTTNRTYYDDIKAKLKKTHYGWQWTIRDSQGSRMAQGEEFTLKTAYGQAALAVSSIRLWSTYARGTITPSTDGRRWFTFENTEGSRNLLI
jgi:hypothetical protein